MGAAARRRLRVAVWLIFWLLQAPALQAQLRRYEYSADAMGGTFSVAVYTTTRAHGDAAAAAAFAELRRFDRMLSPYRAESEWSEVNRHAAERAVHVRQELFDLVSVSLEYSRRSEGAFDITVGPLMRAWDFQDGTGQLASDQAIRHARARVGYAHVLLDAAHRTIRFDRPGVELDPGGIGKGYAVDRMIGVLKERGIDRALVSAAGSSIYAMGTPPGEDGWPVAIGGPVSGSSEGQLLLKDESLSTSGSSGKFFRAGGQVYGHILDPRTGYPAGGFLAAVVAPRALDSEAWTKAVLLNTRGWSVRHTPQGWRALFCEDNRRSSCKWLVSVPEPAGGRVQPGYACTGSTRVPPGTGTSGLVGSMVVNNTAETASIPLKTTSGTS
jgi:thiamine biosynthesis lipoprotein